MELHQTVPELPVRDVEETLRYYRDRLGFTIGWHNEQARIGAVSHGDCVIFFRQTDGDAHSATFWIFADDVDAAFADLARRGADIVDPVADRPWGLRQFTLKDNSGNLFHFHHDLD